jgi:hypothetical protein
LKIIPTKFEHSLRTDEINITFRCVYAWETATARTVRGASDWLTAAAGGLKASEKQCAPIVSNSNLQLFPHNLTNQLRNIADINMHLSKH